MSDEPIRAREKCYPPVWLILNTNILLNTGYLVTLVLQPASVYVKPIFLALLVSKINTKN